MNKSIFSLFENYMLDCMKDSAHDKDHIYRVLYNALDIAKHTYTEEIDYDVLICACLLHDIGREEQFANPKLCHAEVGGEKAYNFLIENKFTDDFALKVKSCIQTHRFRKNNPPESIEAKILFDADKMDVCGAIGVARTLVYRGRTAEPLYSLNADGSVSDGTNDSASSFFREYKYKLENVYSHFYTEYGAELAEKRQQAAIDFYNNLFSEVNLSYKNGTDILDELIDN